MIFLWLFLPFVLVINLMLPIRLSNLFLLAMSFIFYAWGEQEYIWLLLLSLTVNYAGAMGMEAMRGRGKEAAVTPNRLLLVLLVAVNLVFLGYFKYFDFLAGLANKLAGGTVAEPRNLLLPVGISFYTFQMISYVADVYRGTIAAEPNPLNLGLYISFFPR